MFLPNHGRSETLTARFATVIFDCDSTLSRIEGIDRLAGKQRARVTELTATAMAGRIPLEEIYRRRLELIRPSRHDVERVGRLYIEERVPGAAQVIRRLSAAGVQVRIVSGGLRPAVLELSRFLGIEDHMVQAVDVYFDDAGGYAGFEEDSPLARSGGKLEVLGTWAADAPRPRMLVGDGATDLEARPAVESFVAFTGVVRRENVVAAADEVIEGPTLDRVVELALGRDLDGIRDPGTDPHQQAPS